MTIKLAGVNVTIDDDADWGGEWWEDADWEDLHSEDYCEACGRRHEECDCGECPGECPICGATEGDCDCVTQN